MAPPPSTATPSAGARTRNGDSGDDTYIRLRDLIVRGRLAPGSRIVETDISSRLGVSRTPVRSALQRLHHEGYLRADDGKKQSRMSVTPLTRHDGEELYEILAHIEGLAARRAARLPDDERTRVADALRRVNSALERAVRNGGNASRIYDLHTRFHRTFVAATRAPRLARLHRTFKPQAERYRRLYSRAHAADAHMSIQEHILIIDSIAAGDPDAAEEAARANWYRSAHRLARLIDQEGERGRW